MNQDIEKNIVEAAKVIGNTWPLYSFVTSNPLKELENNTFEHSVSEAGKLLKASVYPEAAIFEQALNNGEIDRDILSAMLSDKGFSGDVKESLKLIASAEGKKQKNKTHEVDRILVKWLAAFLDEGLAEWEMPHKTEGFYQSWRSLAIHDTEINTPLLKDLPKTSDEVLEYILKDFPAEQHIAIFKFHLAALPGWVGYIKHRNENNTLWQQNFPISFADYLAVRLMITKLLKFEILPTLELQNENIDRAKLQHLWLACWEKSFQNTLVESLKVTKNSKKNNVELPDAQLIFCIDTRSELLRRQIEATGNYETFGYAGFFGIAMDYENPTSGIVRKSCPPIVGSAYQVTEKTLAGSEPKMANYIKKEETKEFGNYFLKRMKNMLPSAFGFVEASGVFYGLSMISRTVFPGLMYGLKKSSASGYEAFSKPLANCVHTNHQEITLQEKIGIVKSAIDLMGFNQFAPLIIVAGHGSHSANNAFGSSLDCGACAASPGRHNARLFAQFANSKEVRKALNQSHGIEIPDDCLFIAAEHNTTTDNLVIFDSDLPNSHQQRLAQLKKNLQVAQLNASKNRFGHKDTTIEHTHKKANNWAETRPEWGLARNAAFVIGPRALTKDVNLDNRCFLQSYNWELDKEGVALESIMQGPMVVTQWINNHYYFSTVDNDKFGGGNKITHNVTGKFGVVQGNGGDLKMGLPLQSVRETDDKMFHQPLRLSVIIQAPRKNVESILAKNSNLKGLLDNEWIYLMVMDPIQKNEVLLYQKGMQWKPKAEVALNIQSA